MTWEANIDDLVKTALADKPASFGSLLRRLPNIYPGDVLASIDRLGARGLQIQTFAVEEPCAENVLSLPIPHPLDYEWRYTHETRDFLSRTLSGIARGGRVVLLGTPSIFLTHQGQEELHLLDANEHLREFVQPERFHHFDVLADDLPSLSAELVLADPPWYPEHLVAFLIAGAQLLRESGTLLLSLPGFGTRPTVAEELAALYATASSAGLRHEETSPGQLRYDIPPFERNAFRAAGIALDLPWRAGDLARFTKTGPCRVERTLQRPAAWDEYRFGSVRIRVQRAALNRFGDPRLVKIVENDVLPTVSRRDCRRDRATIWTSGNRIFETRGLSTLHEILQALQGGVDPFATHVELEERSLIALAVAQIHELIACETSENEKNTA
jgi:hypothetical protein